MFALTFIVILVAGIFVYDVVRRWWLETEWKRRLKRRND